MHLQKNSKKWKKVKKSEKKWKKRKNVFFGSFLGHFLTHCPKFLFKNWKKHKIRSSNTKKLLLSLLFLFFHDTSKNKQNRIVNDFSEGSKKPKKAEKMQKKRYRFSIFIRHARLIMPFSFLFKNFYFCTFFYRKKVGKIENSKAD